MGPEKSRPAENNKCWVSVKFIRPPTLSYRVNHAHLILKPHDIITGCHRLDIVHICLRHSQCNLAISGDHGICAKAPITRKRVALIPPFRKRKLDDHP